MKTNQELNEEYGDVLVSFQSYYKYSFAFGGEKDGHKITAYLGGASHDIYKLSVNTIPFLFREFEWESVYLDDECIFRGW